MTPLFGVLLGSLLALTTAQSPKSSVDSSVPIQTLITPSASNSVSHSRPTTAPSWVDFRKRKDCGYNGCVDSWTRTSSSTDAGGTVYVYEVQTITWARPIKNIGCGIIYDGNAPPDSHSTVATRIIPPPAPAPTPTPTPAPAPEPAPTSTTPPPPPPDVTVTSVSTQQFAAQESLLSATTVTMTNTPLPNVEQVIVMQTEVFEDLAQVNVVSYAIVGPSGAAATTTAILGTNVGTSIQYTRTLSSLVSSTARSITTSTPVEPDTVVVTTYSTFTPPTTTMEPITVTVTTDVVQLTTLNQIQAANYYAQYATAESAAPSIVARVTHPVGAGVHVVATSTLPVYVNPTAYARGYHLDHEYVHQLGQQQLSARRREAVKRC